MHNAQQEIKWHEIVNEVMSDPKLNIVKVLLEKGIDINAVDLRGETILTIATESRTIDIGIINAIIKAGANINATTKHGTTALHRAAFNGRLDIVETLIAEGANPKALGRSEETALHRAAEAGRTEVVKFLLLQKGVKVDSVSQYGCTALHLAASYGHAKTTLALLEAGAYVNAKTTKALQDTPLHQAVAFASANYPKAQETVEILLMYDADISSKNRYDETPIGEATGNIKQLMESQINRMKGIKIGTINYGDNQEDVSLHDFFTANRTKLVQYCSNSEIRTHIRTNLKDIYPMFYTAIREQFNKGVQLIIYQTVMTNFLEGGKINNETTGKTEQLPSIAGAEYVSLKIRRHLTDTDVQEVAKKALTTTKS